MEPIELLGNRMYVSEAAMEGLRYAGVQGWPVRLEPAPAPGLNRADLLRLGAMIALWGPLCLLPDDPALIGLAVWLTFILIALHAAVGFPWQLMAMVFLPGFAVEWIHWRFGLVWGYALLFVGLGAAIGFGLMLPNHAIRNSLAIVHH